ncbi:hypothetical protein LINGRAPRIM_LOCUS1219, partial [Linum grandiflorum]
PFIQEALCGGRKSRETGSKDQQKESEGCEARLQDFISIYRNSRNLYSSFPCKFLKLLTMSFFWIPTVLFARPIV